MLRETNPKTKAETPSKFAKLPALGVPVAGNAYLNTKEGRRIVILKNGRYIHLARYIMTQIVGYEIPTHIHVHHRDGNKLNDTHKNLELIDVREHSRHHAKNQGRGYTNIVCSSCGKSFEVRVSALDKKIRRSGKSYKPVCSRACYRKLQQIKNPHKVSPKVKFLCACGCGRTKEIAAWKYRSNEKRGRQNVYEHACATRLGNQKRLGMEI